MMPPEVISIRHDLCKCEGVNHDDPCAGCPIGHFGAYMICPEGETRPGLGDRVASIAQPIAKGIDAILGTNIANCGGCAKRKNLLNSLSRPSQKEEK